MAQDATALSVVGNPQLVARIIEICNEPTGTGFVYFIRCTGSGLVKIGWAWNVFARMRVLQTASPHPLEVIAVQPDASRSFEGELHRAFADLRHHGEWFRFEGDLEQAVNELLHEITG